jgi:hypothetical protein
MVFYGSVTAFDIFGESQGFDVYSPLGYPVALAFLASHVNNEHY